MHRFIEKSKYLWSKTNRFHRVLTLFIILGLQPLPSIKYGFYCGDPALSYPFTGDTISWKWLMVVCMLMPLVSMLIAERKYHNTDKERCNKRVLRWYKEYMYGYLVNLTSVQLLKYIVGSPRPHFFDTCRPEEASTCADSEYVSSYTCSKGQWGWQSDKSFPSGHTSLSIYAGFYIAYYLHKRVPSSTLVKSLEGASIVLSVLCSVSRLSDRRHHWWDVLAGAAIGLLVLFYTIFNLCKNFVCTEKSTDAQAPPTNDVSNGKASLAAEILT